MKNYYNIAMENYEHQILCNQIRYVMVHEEDWTFINKDRVFRVN